MQPYLSYVDSFLFFLNVLLYDEMDFVFDGTVQPRALPVLPPTEEGRSAEASTRHPRDPSHPGHPSCSSANYQQYLVSELAVQREKGEKLRKSEADD